MTVLNAAKRLGNKMKVQRLEKVILNVVHWIKFPRKRVNSKWNILNERDSLGIGDNSSEIKSSQN